MKVILFTLAMNGHDVMAFHSIEGCQKVRDLLEQVAQQEIGQSANAICYEDRGYKYEGKNAFPIPFQF